MTRQSSSSSPPDPMPFAIRRPSLTSSSVLLPHDPTDSSPPTPGPLAPTIPPLEIAAATSSALTLSSRLRLATTQAHHDVMLPSIVHRLSSGDLPLPIYLNYLQALLGVYTSLERMLDRHRSNACLASIYDPALLARTAGLEKDLRSLSQRGTEERGWKEDGREWKATIEYAKRLEDLGSQRSEQGGEEWGEPATLLIAHSYTRYLGDLSGGQSIARSIRRVYTLPDSGEGSQFYEFYLPSSTSGLPERAGVQEAKRIKRWFREGLDLAGQKMSEEMKSRVEDEAKRAFKFNAELFTELERALKEYEASLEAPKERVTSKIDRRPMSTGDQLSSRPLLQLGLALALALVIFIACRGAPAPV